MSSLWLITTFFNPLNWSSRRRNYDTFRRHLKANLLTVEWSPNGDFSLREDDADRLVRVSGGELMWQKERLINIGLEHLPDDCDLVGWVDCDIAFRDPHWALETRDLLQDHDLIQLFAAAEFLDAEASLEPDPLEAGLAPVLRPSLIQVWRNAADREGFLAQEIERRQRQLRGERMAHAPEKDSPITPGLAWAAQRHWLEQIGGLPDRAVIGGGDLQAAYGFLNLLGDFDRIMRQHEGPGGYVASHCLDWGNRVQRTAPKIGHLSGTLLHLHHGDRNKRNYVQRQYDLMGTGFLPDEHLELDSGGAWRFSDSAPKTVRTVMARYFASREEDGAAAQR